MVEVVVYNGAAVLDEEMLRQEPLDLRSRLGELTLSGDLSDDDYEVGFCTAAGKI